MVDNGVKVYSYENSDFVEIPETYYSTESNDITFIKNKRIFKIEIPENMMVGGKRKMDDSIYIDDDDVASESSKKIKTLEEDNKTLEETINNLKIALEKTRIESKIMKEQKNNIVKNLEDVKKELLNARVKIEENVRDKTRAIMLCNKLRKQIIDTNMAKKK